MTGSPPFGTGGFGLAVRGVGPKNSSKLAADLLTGTVADKATREQI